MPALLIVLAFIHSILPIPASAFEDVRTPIVVAVQSEGSDLHEDAVESLEFGLSSVFNDHAVEFKRISIHELNGRGGRFDFDFLLSSASVYAALQHYAGFSAVASLTDVPAASSEHAGAAVVLVRRSKGYRTLGDLSDARIGLCAQTDPEVEFYIGEELRLRGISKNGGIRFVDLGYSEVERCLAGFSSSGDSVDALALRASDRLEPNLLRQLNLAVLEPRLNDDLNLPHTTATYPGWILSAGFKTSRDLQNRVGAFVRTLGRDSGVEWNLPADVRPLHSALQKSDSFYSSFSPKTIYDYVGEYKTFLVGFLVALLAAVLHMIRTGHLLRKRTKELMLSNELRMEGERRFHLLEKQSIVGQISSIVAHEIRQPLAAVSNYAMALRRRSENGILDEESLSYGLKRMVEESARANEIVEYVQKFVRRSEKNKEWLNLAQEVRMLADSYRSSAGQPLVDSSACADVQYYIDKMDVRLITENLVKNALEASRGSSNRAVEASCGILEDSSVFIKVVDSGPKLTDEEFKRLSSPLNSSKMGGLGLGVSIVRLIAEGYGGHLEFSRCEPSGICAKVVLPGISRQEERSDGNA